MAQPSMVAFSCSLLPQAIDYVEGDQTVWEQSPLERLAREGELFAYHHGGFWQAMDTLRDKKHVEELWQNGEGALWRVW